MNKHKRNAGFTVVELMIVIIMGAVLFSFITAGAVGAYYLIAR